MFKIIVILAAFGYCSSNPPTILDYVNHIEPYNYVYRYLTSDDIGQEELGELKSPGTPEEHYVVQEKTSWTSPERIPYVVTSVSDNNGYHINSPDKFQSYSSSIFFVGVPAIGILNHPAFNPPTPLTLQQHSIYSTTSLEPGSPTVIPSTHLGPQQYFISSTASLKPNHPTVNPSTHLGPQQNYVYSTASLQPGSPTVIPSIHLGPQQHSIESLKLKHQPVNPVIFYKPQKHSIYSIEHLKSGLQSGRPAINPSTLLEPQQYSIDSLQPELNSSRPTAKPTTSRPSIRPIQTYVPPPKSTTFGPQEDTLPANRQPSTGTGEGVTPAGPPRVQPSTVNALLGTG